MQQLGTQKACTVSINRNDTKMILSRREKNSGCSPLLSVVLSMSCIGDIVNGGESYLSQVFLHSETAVSRMHADLLVGLHQGPNF